MLRPLPELSRLVRLVARLRAPKGCPWDRAQTHVSLIRYLREEAKELERALRRGRWHEVEDELGDLLLQVLLHARIEEEAGRFDIEDVAKSQRLKLRRRHPHVFGKRRFKTPRQVLANWDRIKAEERRRREADLVRRGGKK
ncbi:MAG: hypothetical protein NTX64_10595 [Elusimicrobia bacterium]|nr:hypothetical protein [Elusimicrobiota bacterium]